MDEASPSDSVNGVRKIRLAQSALSRKSILSTVSRASVSQELDLAIQRISSKTRKALLLEPSIDLMNICTIPLLIILAGVACSTRVSLTSEDGEAPVIPIRDPGGEIG